MPETEWSTAAQQYTRLGYSVFPCQPKGKQPAIAKCDTAREQGLSGSELAAHAQACDGDGHGCHDATVDTATVRRWWEERPTANIGIATGEPSGIVVIDIDDPDSFEAFEADHGELPATLTVLTGGGGEHRIYRRPVGGLRNSARRLAPGVDVRGDGGYIVAPPSIHPDGDRYRWLDNTDPVDLPQWVIDLLTAEPESGEPTRSGASGEPGGTPWGRRVLDGELSRLLSAHEGQRNNTLFHAACKVSEACKAGELDEVEGRDRLEQAASRILNLPLDEVRATVESAWQRTKPRTPKPRDTAPDSTPAQPVEEAKGQRSDGMLTYEDLFALEPAKWVIPQRVPEGLTILFAPPKTGKTFVALDWTLYTAATQTRPVVYCSGEGARSFQHRVQAWCQQHPDLDPTATFRVRAMGSFPRLLEPHSVQRLHEDLSALDEPPHLLVVDTWARALTGGDENTYKDVSRALDELDRIQDRYGTNIVLLTHTAFPPGGAKPQRPRGHGALDGNADAMWRIDAPKQSGEWHELICTAMKESAQPPPVQFTLAPRVNSLTVEPPVRMQVDPPPEGNIL